MLTPDTASSPRPVALVAGLGVLLNVIAVAALQSIPHTYAPGHVPLWLDETLAHPTATAVSAWAFTVGLVALAAFFICLPGLVRTPRSTWLSVGAVFASAGALLDAAGTMAPLAATHVDPAVGLALLWLSLLLDAAFNFLLGLGLLAFAWGLPDDWKWLRRLGAVAGALSIPVAGQFASDDFARLLAIAGPLWLTWIVAVAFTLWRRA